MPQSEILRIGTRGSKLALAQTRLVQDALRQRCGIESELVVIRTSGDRVQDRPLADLGGKGLFAKELEEALLADEIDAAVHSMKDLPTELPGGLSIIATLPRDDPSDVFISRRWRRIEDMQGGARIGTSSVRRKAQLARLRSDIEAVALRGNIDTRLARLDAGDIDGIILALAGLKRIGAEARATAVLTTGSWLPALSQGAIGLEMRVDDARVKMIAAGLNDEPTSIALACERAFQAALDGSCRTSIAGLALIHGTKLRFRGEVLAPDGSDSLATQIEATLGADAGGDAARAGRNAGLSLRERARPWLAL